jgi:hypothetical protein
MLVRVPIERLQAWNVDRGHSSWNAPSLVLMKFSDSEAC